MTDRILVLGVVLLALAVVAIWVRARPRVLTSRFRRGDLAAALVVRGHPAILAFTSPDCAACRAAQRPALEELTSLTAGRVATREIDILEAPDVAQAFGIFTVPTTVLLDGRGAVVAVNIGFASAEKLLSQLGLDGRSARAASEDT